MRTRTLIACTAAIMLTRADGAGAQTLHGTAAPSQIGFRAYATCDSLRMAASKTFTAVFGSSTLTACGGGAEVVNLWKQVFVRFGASSTSATGQRVFVSDGVAYPLGIRLTMSMAPREVGVGWRFATRRTNRFVPYAGAGAVWLTYKETSDFADSGENVSKRLSGSTFFGGVDFAVLRFLTTGAEVQYRTLTATGLTGAADGFSEKNIAGGAAARFFVGFRY